MKEPGMISYDELTDDDFILPELPQPFLPGTKSGKTEFYLGLPGWNYREELKKKNSPFPQPGTLPYYAGYFNAVELSETHDTIPAADTVAKWNKAVEKDVFKFCPQFYKGISHTGNIDIHKTGLTNSFISRLSILKEKLGTAVLEIREGTPFEQKDRLLKYLETLPQDFPVSLDIKSPEWFSNGELFHEFVKSLHRINKGLVITDSPGRRALVHMQLATSTAYVRFVCEGWNEIDLFRISEWKRQLKSWFAVGLEKCFFMLHIHNREGMEDFINYVREELDF